MKVYEYLSAGLSVVSTPLPSLMDQPIEGLHITPPAEFVSTVTRELDLFSEAAAAARTAAARPHSWSARTEAALELLHRHVSGPRQERRQ
jgi:hypothetical protein